MMHSQTQEGSARTDAAVEDEILAQQGLGADGFCGGHFPSDDSCGCGHDHAGHAHGDTCDCGHDHDHDHEHDESCPCCSSPTGEHPTADPEIYRDWDLYEGIGRMEFDFIWGDCTLHVRQWGDPEAQPIVLLHGFMQAGDTWDFFGPELGEDHCVLALDLLGHGLSSKPHDPALYTYDALADSVASFLDRIACVNPVTGARRRAHVLGYSMGGRLALRLVEKNADLLYSVMLESCGLGPVDDAERAAAAERNEGWARRLREDGMASFVEYWEGLPLFATQRERGLDARLREGRLANDAEAMALVAEQAGKHAMPAEGEALGALQATWLPVLYLCGEDDETSSRPASLMEQAGFEVSRAATGHNFHLEAPMLYLRIVQDFLSGIEMRGQWLINPDSVAE